MKKAIITLSCIALLTIGTAFAADGNFTDVPSDAWYKEDLKEVSAKGIIAGYPDGLFHPTDTLTYGQFIKMATVSMTGQDVGASKEGNWALNYYNQGLEQKLYTQMDIKENMLADPIRRKHMALIVSNASPGTVISDYDVIKNSIQDLDSGRAYEHAIVKAYGLGIITGYTDGTFKPDGMLDRSESSAVMARLGNEAKRKYPDIAALKAKEEPKEVVPPLVPKEEEPTTVKRDFTSVENLSLSSTSTLPVTDVASNIYDFKRYNDPNEKSIFQYIKYYEILKEYPYEVKKAKAKDGADTIDISKDSNFGQAVLIKDNKIVCQLVSTEIDDGRNYISFYKQRTQTLPDFDYIAFYNSSDSEFDTLILIANSFK